MTFATVDTGRVEALLRRVAEEQILPYFQALSDDDVQQKTSDQDLVTVADVAAEKALTAALPDILPGCLIVGEEAVSEDKDVLKRLDDPQPVWVIDPIDGTFNFAHGTEKFGTLLSLVEGGVVTHGWIYDIIGDRMVSAVKGQGAYLETKDGKTRLELGPAPDVRDMRGQLGGFESSVTRKLRDSLGEAIHMRSSLHDMLNLAIGETDFGFWDGTTPWDHSGGTLIVTEAGGTVGLLSGDAYEPDLIGKHNLLAAKDEAGWNALQNVIRDCLDTDTPDACPMSA